MSDNENETPPEQLPERAPGLSGVQDQEINLVITVKGPQLMVNGPLHDTIFCYGVLERAKDVIRTMRDQKQQSPPGTTPAGLHIPAGGFRPPKG